MTTQSSPSLEGNSAEPVGVAASSSALEDASVIHAHPADRLRLLWEQRKFISKAVLTGLIATTILAFVIPKQYKSTTQLMPPDAQSSSSMALLAAMAGRATSGLGGLTSDLLGIRTSGALFIGILHSRVLQDRLITQFDLKKVYGNRRFEDARQDLARHTSISEDRKSGILSITVTDRSPGRAAAIAQAYATELNNLVTELNTSAAHRERTFLEERLKAVKQDLETAEKEFSEFSSKNAAIDIKEQGRTMMEAAAMLQGQLIAGRAELEGLSQIYTDENVRVRSVKARIAELQRQLEKLGGGDVAGSGSTSQPVASLYPSIRKLPILGVTYADLFRRTKVQETVYELLTQEYELAKVQEAKETPSVKVLDPADIPEMKFFPPRRLIVLVGAILSFAVAIGWVFGRSRWEETSPNDPGRMLAAEVLATMRKQLPWQSHNGSSYGAAKSRVWDWIRRSGERPS